VIAALQAIDAQRPGGVRLVFLAAAPESLLRRFEVTRRRHPLAPDRPVVDGIRHERELIQPLREAANLIVDTTDFAPVDLRRVLEGHFAPAAHGGMTIAIVSFAYRNGVPRRGRPGVRRALPAQPHYDPVLGRAPRNDPAVAPSSPIQAMPASAPRSMRCCCRCCRASARRARLTSRSRSAAPADGTARWWSPSGSQGVLQRAGYPASLHHRDLAQPSQEAGEQGENPRGAANSRQEKAKGASA
jgi:hypothetical protein